MESTDRLIPDSPTSLMFITARGKKIGTMFLALKDILHARGRFGLIASVVGLITLLVVMLSGLTEGLAQRNISALQNLGVQGYAIELTEDEPNFTGSNISRQEVAQYQQQGEAFPLGTANTTLNQDGSTVAVAALGVPAGTELPSGDLVPEDGIVASEELDLQAGTSVSVGGRDVQVAETTGTEYFSHSPVVWMSTATWQEVTHSEAEGSAIALLKDPDTYEGSVPTFTVEESFNALPAYASEQRSLMLIQAFLYIISALVIISFLTVWTIQRSRDLAILRAIGAGSKYLLVDALGQAALVLAVGSVAGAGLGAGLGFAISDVAPFHLDLTTVVIPAVLVFALGLVGAALATRSISKVDPLSAFSAV